MFAGEGGSEFPTRVLRALEEAHGGLHASLVGTEWVKTVKLGRQCREDPIQKGWFNKTEVPK